VTEGGETKRPTNKQLDRLGVFLLIVGAVIGMGVAWIGTLPISLSIGMIVLALVLVAAGLALSRKYKTKDDI
jgi:magnesium-transporting ATPase (P-type)